jgi:hypothetical protein
MQIKPHPAFGTLHFFIAHRPEITGAIKGATTRKNVRWEGNSAQQRISTSSEETRSTRDR